MADGIDIKFESKEVQGMISKLLNRVENPSVLMSTLKRWIHAQTMLFFRGRRPDSTVVRGQKWPALKASTVKQKKNLVSKGGALVAARPMVRTGVTRDSLKVLDSRPRGFSYGTRVKSKKGFPYPGHWNKGKFPFLFLNQRDYNQIVKATVDFLNGKLKSFKHYTSK